MQVVLDFILANWKYILFACCLLVEIILWIIAICKKKVKVVDSAFAAVLIKMPQFIIEAEQTGLTGSEKYSLVLRKCLDLLVSLTGLSCDDVLSLYLDKLDSSIENILGTPQKKEEKDEEKTK